VKNTTLVFSPRFEQYDNKRKNDCDFNYRVRLSNFEPIYNKVCECIVLVRETHRERERDRERESER
jgi:hypothetical protein